MDRYIVECRVSGGVTGTRTGVLKDQQGKIRKFPTFEAAHEEAQRLTATLNNAFSTATFSYRATHESERCWS